MLIEIYNYVLQLLNIILIVFIQIKDYLIGGNQLLVPYTPSTLNPTVQTDEEIIEDNDNFMTVYDKNHKAKFCIVKNDKLLEISKKLNPDNKKYALIISISDYVETNDLSYCDEDANSMYKILIDKGYYVILLGDKSSQYYYDGKKIEIDGLATIKNIDDSFDYINGLLQNDQNNKFVLYVSSHGFGSNGDSMIITYDTYDDYTYNGEKKTILLDGYNNFTNKFIGYTDEKLETKLKEIKNKCQVLCFFDCCMSGGLLEETITNSKNACSISTCGNNGYGYDDYTTKHGKMTNKLIKAINNNIESMSKIYEYIINNYGEEKEDDKPMILGNKTLTL